MSDKDLSRLNCLPRFAIKGLTAHAVASDAYAPIWLFGSGLLIGEKSKKQGGEKENGKNPSKQKRACR